jgi:hypothetical protein
LRTADAHARLRFDFGAQAVMASYLGAPPAGSAVFDNKAKPAFQVRP